MKHLKTWTSLSLLIIMMGCGQQEEKKMNTYANNTAIDKANMNAEIQPGNDFFRFANGGWMEANPIPEEYSRFGAFEVLDKLNKERIKGLIDEISQNENAEKGTPAQQIRDFYLAAMDTSRINELGFTPIQPLLDEISKMESIDQVPVMVANLNMKGIFPVYAVFATQDDKNSDRVIANGMQGGLSLPDRDYYTNDDPRSIEIRSEYLKYIQTMHKKLGDSEEDAARKAKAVLAFETQLAQASMTIKERRNPDSVYHLMTKADFVSSMNSYKFDSYLAGIGIGNITEINIRQPKFFSEVDKMAAEKPLEDWKIYLSWKVINGTASLLGHDIEQERFNFYGTTLSGTPKMQERWKRMVSAINGNLGEAMGKLYVEKYFPQESKDRMLELVGNLKIALESSIKNLDWMQAETKEKALEKLNTMRVKVGYPNKWKDYSSIDITADSYVQNSWNCDAFGYRENLDKIGKPVDREEWGMTPQTVNAYYSPNMNEIVFPAAILQPPFFDASADDAVNYGAIGVVIGHEMTHGFDDQGRKYDKDGNLNDWWTEEDAKNFEQKTQILVDQYNNYSMLDSLHIDGKMTLGENIADNGGLFLAYAALLQSFEKNGTPEDIDSLNYNQRFCISYAQVWRQNIRDKELMRRLKTDVHSPGEARVNAGLANLPWWYEAFNITPENKFYIAPEKRAKIW